VFQDQGCYACHTVGKTVTPIGPDRSQWNTDRNLAPFERSRRAGSTPCRFTRASNEYAAVHHSIT
jgi:hypothetical protein